MRRVVFALAVAALTFSAIFVGTAIAARNDQVPLYGNPGVGTCAGNTSGPDRGFMNYHLKKDGSLLVNIHVRNGLPNEEYLVGLRCLGYYGTLTTDSEGVGNATILFTNWSPAFGIELDPPAHLEHSIHAPPNQPRGAELVKQVLRVLRGSH